MGGSYIGIVGPLNSFAKGL